MNPTLRAFRRHDKPTREVIFGKSCRVKVTYYKDDTARLWYRAIVMRTVRTEIRCSWRYLGEHPAAQAEAIARAFFPAVDVLFKQVRK